MPPLAAQVARPKGGLFAFDGPNFNSYNGAMKIAQTFYGVYWRIEKDDEEDAAAALTDALQADDNTDLYDLMDKFVTDFSDAHVMFSDDHKTVVMGLLLTATNEGDNDFDEMSILGIIDKDKGVLRDSVRQQMRNLIETVPVDLRTKFTAPGFYVVWSEA